MMDGMFFLLHGFGQMFLPGFAPRQMRLFRRTTPAKSG
jgi:hypothetical protein